MYLATCGSEVNLFAHPDYNLVQSRAYQQQKCYDLKFNCESNVIALIVQNEKKFGCTTDDCKKFIEISTLNKYELQNTVNWFNIRKSINAISFAKANPRFLAAAIDDPNQVFVYDIRNQLVLKHFQKFTAENPFNVLDFSYCDNYLAAGCFNDGVIQLFNVGRNTKSSVLQMDKLQTVQTVNFSPLHKNDLATGGYEGDLIIWDITSLRRKIVANNCHNAPIMAFEFSPRNNKQAFSVGFDCALKIYDLSTSKMCQVTNVFDVPLSSLAVTSNGLNIAISSINGDVFVVDIRKSKSIMQQFHAYTNTSSSREIFRIGYLNSSNQKKPFEIEAVEEAAAVTPPNRARSVSFSNDPNSPQSIFEFNKSTSNLSNIIDSHESCDFALWEKFRNCDVSAQSSPFLDAPVAASNKCFDGSQTVLGPVVEQSIQTPISMKHVLSEFDSNIENKENLPTSPKLSQTGNESEVFVSKIDKSIQTANVSPQEPVCSSSQSRSRSGNENNQSEDQLNPLGSVLSNPMFIMHYLMDYAEYKVKQEERFELLMDEMRNLSEQIAQLDHRFQEFTNNF